MGIVHRYMWRTIQIMVQYKNDGRINLGISSQLPISSPRQLCSPSNDVAIYHTMSINHRYMQFTPHRALPLTMRYDHSAYDNIDLLQPGTIVAALCLTPGLGKFHWILYLITVSEN